MKDKSLKFYWSIAIFMFLALFIFQLVLLNDVYQLEERVFTEKVNAVIIEKVGTLNMKQIVTVNKNRHAVSFNSESRRVFVVVEDGVRAISIGQKERDEDVIMRSAYDVCDVRWSLLELDSLVRKEMAGDYKEFPLKLMVTDSMGGVFETVGRISDERGCQVITIPLGYLTGRVLTGYFYFLFADFWMENSDRIIMAGALSLLLVLVLFFLVGTIFRQRRLGEQRDNFMHIVAHDLKSPLNFIRLSNSFIRKKSVSPYMEDQEKLYKQVNDRLLTMTERIQRLLMNSVGGHGLILDRKEMVLGERIGQLIKEYELTYDERVSFIWNDGLGKSPVLVDSLHFMAVITNLVENAIKYAEGAVVVKMSCEDRGKEWCMMVKDNGPGISKGEQPYVFKKYYRGKGIMREKKGFGLGLNYVEHVVRAHGGHIELRSEEGHGCEFIIVMPWKIKK